MAAMLESIRPMMLSTRSSAEMSIMTPRAGLNEFMRKIVLQRHRQLVVHVELDADKQAPPDLQDRYLLHGGSNLKSA